MKIKVGTYKNNFTDLVVMVWLTLNQPCEISRASGFGRVCGTNQSEDGHPMDEQVVWLMAFAERAPFLFHTAFSHLSHHLPHLSHLSHHLPHLSHRLLTSLTLPSTSLHDYPRLDHLS